MNRTPPKQPMIVVVGSTGTGKSKLAVSLASKYNGEIINADAIQMYRGLPIVTNKIPDHERNGVPHYLLDQIGFEQNPWTVNEFVEETSKIINDIRARGKLPIVVGGTNYYVFSLIFEESILADSDSDEKSEVDGPALSSIGHETASAIDLSILNEPTEVVLAKLQEIDPVMAASWHPKDRRKIQRSLEICLKSGRKASDVYEEQKFIKHQIASESSVPTLRHEPLVFWLEAEDAVLKARLNSRVDTMVRDGLFEEVKEMRAFAVDSMSKGISLNKNKGIWIAIGYKELEPWLDAYEESSADTTTLSALREEGIEAIKAATRQYAKRQHRWIRIRLAQHLKSARVLDKLYLLDGTDLAAWDEMVAIPSESITRDYLAGQKLPDNSSLSRLASQTFEYMQSQDKISGRQARFCETCQKTMMTEQEWVKHVKSNRHKKVVEGIRRRAQQTNDQSVRPPQQQSTASI